jgi:hypothetical protein
MIPAFFEQLGHDEVVAFHMAQNGYFYNTCSVLHYFCVFVMTGLIILVDLRVLGVAGKRTTMLQLANQLSPWMWTAFTIAMITGFLEFLPIGRDFSGSLQFQLKIFFIVLSVFSAIIVLMGVKKWSGMSKAPGGAKVIAVLSILCFLLAILFALNVASFDGVG